MNDKENSTASCHLFSPKDHRHTSTKLHHITTVILSVACISVITVISDSQCELNKARFHGLINLLLKKYGMSLKSNMGF